MLQTALKRWRVLKSEVYENLTQALGPFVFWEREGENEYFLVLEVAFETRRIHSVNNVCKLEHHLSNREKVDILGKDKMQSVLECHQAS